MEREVWGSCWENTDQASSNQTYPSLPFLETPTSLALSYAFSVTEVMMI